MPNQCLRFVMFIRKCVDYDTALEFWALISLCREIWNESDSTGTHYKNSVIDIPKINVAGISRLFITIREAHVYDLATTLRCRLREQAFNVVSWQRRTLEINGRLLGHQILVCRYGFPDPLLNSTVVFLKWIFPRRGSTVAGKSTIGMTLLMGR